jgi:amino acid transporter
LDVLIYIYIYSIYTIGPLDQALAASTGYPILNLFYNSTQSLAATNVMTFVLIFNFTASGIASLAAASRQLWSFARSDGVPFSRFLAPVRTVSISSFPASANFYRLNLNMIFLLMRFFLH